MIVRIKSWHVLAAVAALAFPGVAFAASDVSNSGSKSNQAVTSVAAPIASSQTASLISSAIGGGFASSSGTGGGFAPSSGTGGGFAPSSGTGQQGSSLPFMSTRGMAGGSAASKFGVWTQGTYSRVDKSEPGMEMSGNVYNVVAGADYKLTDRYLIGMALSWERTDLDTDFNRGTFTGSGISAVPYFGVTLTPNWTVDVSGGYGWLSYDTDRNNGTVTGSYNARRTFATGNLTGSFAHQNWRFQPKAGVSYIHEFQDSYTEHGGSNAAVASDTLEFGRLSGGTKIGYAIGNGVPYLKLMAEWDFLKPDAVTKANGQISSTSDGGGVIGLGYEIYKGDFIGSIEANYNSLFREDLDLYTVALRARYAF